MAKRNYTTEAYEQIRKTIEEIDNTDVRDVKDFLWDLVLRIGQFLELYSVEQYEQDMQSWYDIVLDSHDTTLAKVNDIFDAVGKVDSEYQKNMTDAVSGVTNFRNTLNCLRDVISGKTSLADGKAAADGYLEEGKCNLNAACDTILTKMQQTTLWDASKALFGDAIKLGLTFIKCRSGSANIADYKNLGDTLLATGCDLLAMTAIVVAPLGAIGDRIDGKMDMSYEDYLDAQFMLLSPTRELKEVNSLSDLLENLAEDMDEQVAKHPKGSPEYYKWKKRADAAQGVSDYYKQVEFAVDLYGVGKDLKSIHDNIDSWMYGKDYTVEEYTKIFEKELPWKSTYYLDGNNGPMINVRTSPGEIISKLFSDRTGFPLSGWNDTPSKTMENGLKVMGTLWSYGEKLLPDPATGQSNGDELPDVFLGKFKETKFLKDVFDLAKGLDEYASGTDSNGAQSGYSGVKGGRYGWSIRENIAQQQQAGSVVGGSARGSGGTMGGR